MRIDGAERLKKARDLFDIGDLNGSEHELDLVLTQNDDDFYAHLLLGVIAAKTNRLGMAETHLQIALSFDPLSFDGLTWLAMVRRSQGDLSAAIDLLQKVPIKDAAVYNLLGISQLSLGQASRAASSFVSAVKLDPQAHEAYHNLGLAYHLLNLPEESLDAFRHATNLDPAHAPNYLQTFKQLQQLSRFREAQEILETGIERCPNSTQLAEALAVAYGRLGLSHKAEGVFTKVSRSSTAAAESYSTWLQGQGRFEDSVRVLQRSIDLQPLQGIAYHGLADVKVFEVGGVSLAETALSRLCDPRIDSQSRMHLAYTVAKCYDFEHRYEEAIRYFDLANELAWQRYPACRTFDPVLTRDDPKIMETVYTRGLLEMMRPFGSSSDKPIFIVGMIRSGTTLLDQIISSHPMVGSAGEQPFWTAEGDRIHRKWREAPDPTDIASLAATYLSVLEEFASTPRITDKMPLNYRHLGLIHTVFPRAKILHIRRNPLDTALSIYTTFFAGGPTFTYNQHNIVVFYEAYIQFMAYWRSILPADTLFEIDYERLVGDPETATREIVEACGLPWDELCLRPHENIGAVNTPSRWQVRQPVYNRSVGRWQRYEPWLGVLLDLKEVVLP